MNVSSQKNKMTNPEDKFLVAEADLVTVEVTIRDAVDCGCCTINEEAVRRVAEWWLTEQASVQEPVDGGAVAAAYEFYNFDHDYVPKRR